VPDPESEITWGEFVALLVIVTLPERLPVVVGSNVTLKEVDCPAASVSGSAEAVAVNPAPLSLICEMVTLELPVFATVTLCVALVPVVRLPKLREVGLAVSCRTEDVPVPVSGTTSDELDELFTNVKLPVTLPAVAGVKPTLKLEEPPAATVSGTVRPVTLKPVPDSVAWVTLRLAVPGFLMVSDCVLATPTATLPKLTLEGVTEIWGCTPVPLSEIVAGELGALLVIAMLPERLPVAAGSRTTLNVVDCFAARTMGSVKPVTLNPVPLTLI